MSTVTDAREISGSDRSITFFERIDDDGEGGILAYSYRGRIWIRDDEIQQWIETLSDMLPKDDAK